MEYGLLDYSSINGKFNIGDYVQSLAAKQYLPRVDKMINREKLSHYDGSEVKVILNGWFMHSPENWPPSEKILPLFTSFHINRPFISRMLTPNAISYMKNVGSIGCRDYYTAEILEAKGIDSYYSSCLTTTLGRTWSHENTGTNTNVLFVDVMHAVPKLSDFKDFPLRYTLSHFKNGNVPRSFQKNRYMNELLSTIPADLQGKVEVIENSIDGENISVESRFSMAEEYLSKLAKANMVVTSRIHCALPCLALGTPVVFIKYGQTSMSNIYRFRGIIDHMNVIDLDGDMKRHGFKSNFLDVADIDWSNPPANPRTFEKCSSALAKQCLDFANS